MLDRCLHSQEILILLGEGSEFSKSHLKLALGNLIGVFGTVCITEEASMEENVSYHIDKVVHDSLGDIFLVKVVGV